MIYTSRPEFLAKPISCSKAKISNGNPHATVKAQHVLWLEVTVVDAKRMAVLHSVKELQKDVFDKVIMAQVAAVVQYLGKEVSVTRIIHDNVGVVSLLDHPM
jgi:hypothetical protein